MSHFRKIIINNQTWEYCLASAVSEKDWPSIVIRSKDLRVKEIIIGDDLDNSKEWKCRCYPGSGGETCESEDCPNKEMFVSITPSKIRAYIEKNILTKLGMTNTNKGIK